VKEGRKEGKGRKEGRKRKEVAVVTVSGGRVMGVVITVWSFPPFSLPSFLPFLPLVGSTTGAPPAKEK
jgi:hypothetical protein